MYGCRWRRGGNGEELENLVKDDDAVKQAFSENYDEAHSYIK